MSLYIFGYGSLIFPAGINGRTTQHFIDEDLHEALLLGYRREWNALWNGMRFLGIVPDKSARTNGVIFRLNEECFEDFAKSEGSAVDEKWPVYEFVDVRCQVSLFPEDDLVLTPQDRVLTCVTIKPTGKGEVFSYYTDIVKKGLKVRGPEFTKEFWSLTPKPKGE